MALKDGALKFVVFLGTVRDGNFGQRAAKFIVKKLNERGHQTTLLGKSAPASHRPPASACCSTVVTQWYNRVCATRYVQGPRARLVQSAGFVQAGMKPHPRWKPLPKITL